MDQSLFTRRNRWRDVLLIVGWLVIVGISAGLVWYSFASEKRQQPETTASPATTLAPVTQATATPKLVFPTQVLATSTPVLATPTPLASPTPQSTAIPPTPSPTPYIVAGEDGVNVRNGPDVGNDQLGYIDPGGQAEYLGTEGNWVQIRFDGEPAWVYGPLVTIFEAQTEPTAVPGETPAPTGEVVAWSEELAQLINQQRTDQGLPPYTTDEALQQAALLHAVDCADRGELTHTGSDGSTVKVRVERAGYSSTNVLEITVTGPSPQFAIDWWMSETPPDDPHRSAILSDWTSEMGVAVVTAGDTYYYVAVFGRP
jgi:uncharacterized protein YkwD